MPQHLPHLTFFLYIMLLAIGCKPSTQVAGEVHPIAQEEQQQAGSRDAPDEAVQPRDIEQARQFFASRVT